MATDQEALDDIVAIARRHNITAAEITTALGQHNDAQAAQKSALPKLFSYVGGILVFSGLCLLLSMQWQDMNSSARVLTVLGAGFCAFLLAIACVRDARYDRAATPLFLIAALVQPVGLGVLLQEYGNGGDARYGVLFITLALLVQQTLTFISLRRTLPGLIAIISGAIFAATLFDLAGIAPRYNTLCIGFSLMCWGHAAAQSRHAMLSPACLLFGSGMFYMGAAVILENTAFEILFLGLCALLIFASTLIRSRMLLLTSTIAMVSYIGWFTAQHFANTAGWPLCLMLIGLALLGFSALAVRLNNKYIKP